VVPIVIAMVLILVIAGVVLAYAAWTDRGEKVPAVPWLGDAMERAVDAAPSLSEEDREQESIDLLR
jgi:hypothetical protein